MSVLDGLFNRSLQPSVTVTVAREQPGPLTAREAFGYAKAEAISLDPHAKLTLITSGTDIRPDGKSFVWEFLFYLKARPAIVLLTYGPSVDEEDIEVSPVMAVRRVSKHTGDVAAELPYDFRDSPEVVEELSKSGVNFVSGPTDMKLETKISPEGKPVWVTYFWGEERSVGFQMSVG